MDKSLIERLEAMAKVMPPSFYGTIAEAAQALTTLQGERDRLRDRVLAVEPTLHEINNVADRVWNCEVDGPSGANRIRELIHAFAVPAHAALHPEPLGEGGGL